MFWPYRPRPGYPSAPGWLIVALLIAVAVLWIVVMAIVDHLAGTSW